MNSASEILKIEGSLNFASLPRILEQTREFAARPDLPDGLVIDLSAVAEVDSSAVALLLEWRRIAMHMGRRLTFDHLPSNLASLAELYGVTDLVINATQ